MTHKILLASWKDGKDAEQKKNQPKPLKKTPETEMQIYLLLFPQ